MFTLPALSYAYDALEPYIDEQTMKLHHDKHHQAYVDNLNKALEGLPADWHGHNNFLNMEIAELLQNLDQIPEDIRTKVRNNGGGHYNHSFFWEWMSPPPAGGGGEPSAELMEAITRDFESLDNFKTKFAERAAGRFGSGWVWLTLVGGKLIISDTPNQDSPIMDGISPILGLDVWEHAYYLKYNNRRPEYVTNWWNVINWNRVNEIFLSQK